MSLWNVCAQSSVDTKIAVNDAKDENTFGEVFKIYCQKTLGIPESNISFVPNATLNEMSYELDHLAEVLNAYDGTARAIIYYTGHGDTIQSSADDGRISRHLPRSVNEPFPAERGTDKAEDTVGMRAENKHREGAKLTRNLIGNVGIGARKIKIVKGLLLPADA